MNTPDYEFCWISNIERRGNPFQYRTISSPGINLSDWILEIYCFSFSE